MISHCWDEAGDEICTGAAYVYNIKFWCSRVISIILLDFLDLRFLPYVPVVLVSVRVSWYVDVHYVPVPPSSS